MLIRLSSAGICEVSLCAVCHHAVCIRFQLLIDELPILMRRQEREKKTWDKPRSLRADALLVRQPETTLTSPEDTIAHPISPCACVSVYRLRSTIVATRAALCASFTSIVCELYTRASTWQEMTSARTPWAAAGMDKTIQLTRCGPPFYTFRTATEVLVRTLPR